MLPKIFSSTFKEVKSVSLFKKPGLKVAPPGGGRPAPFGPPPKLETILRLHQPHASRTPAYTCNRITQVPEVAFVRPPCVCPRRPGLIERVFGDRLRLFNLAVVACLAKYFYDQGYWSDHQYTTRLSMKAQQKFLGPIFPSQKDEPFSFETMKYDVVETWNGVVKIIFYVTIRAPLNLYRELTGRGKCVKHDKKKTDEGTVEEQLTPVAK